MVNYSGNQKAVAFYHTRWIKNNANLCGMLLAIEFGLRNPIKEKELQNVINSQVLNKRPIRLRLAGQDQGLCCRAAEGSLPVWRWWDFSSAICRNYFWVWQGWGLCFIAALRLWLSYFLWVWTTSLHLPSNFCFWGACVVDNEVLSSPLLSMWGCGAWSWQSDFPVPPSVASPSESKEDQLGRVVRKLGDKPRGGAQWLSCCCFCVHGSHGCFSWSLFTCWAR